MGRPILHKKIKKEYPYESLRPTRDIRDGDLPTLLVKFN